MFAFPRRDSLRGGLRLADLHPLFFVPGRIAAPISQTFRGIPTAPDSARFISAKILTASQKRRFTFVSCGTPSTRSRDVRAANRESIPAASDRPETAHQLF
jgi:hypothetical protein